MASGSNGWWRDSSTRVQLLYIPALSVGEEGCNGSTELDARFCSVCDSTSAFGECLGLSAGNPGLASFDIASLLSVGEERCHGGTEFDAGLCGVCNGTSSFGDGLCLSTSDSGLARFEFFFTSLKQTTDARRMLPQRLRRKIASHTLDQGMHQRRPFQQPSRCSWILWAHELWFNIMSTSQFTRLWSINSLEDRSSKCWDDDCSSDKGVGDLNHIDDKWVFLEVKSSVFSLCSLRAAYNAKLE